MNVTVAIYGEKNTTVLVILGITFVIGFGRWFLQQYNKTDFKGNREKLNFLLWNYKPMVGIFIGSALLGRGIF